MRRREGQIDNAGQEGRDDAVADVEGDLLGVSRHEDGRDTGGGRHEQRRPQAEGDQGAEDRDERECDVAERGQPHLAQVGDDAQEDEGDHPGGQTAVTRAVGDNEAEGGAGQGQRHVKQDGRAVVRGRHWVGDVCAVSAH